MENGATFVTENPYGGLVNHISEKLEKLDNSLSTERCIYRVPEIVRKFNEEAYTPRVVSIGPYHHGSEKLQSMEAYKWKYFKKFLQRNNVSLHNYVEFVTKCEEMARKCYAEIIELESYQFVMMILVDGCFIIELLLRSYSSGFRDEDDFIFPRLWLWNDIQQDLILLENQLPIFILEMLFNLTFESVNSIPSLPDLIFNFFDSHNNQIKVPNIRSVKHLTDLIRTLYLPMFPRLPPRNDDDFEVEFDYSATQLHEAGVKFKVGSSQCLLDIHFTNGVLEIPFFKLYDKTNSFIRNLVALELYHYPHDSYIIDYIFFIDSLINTPSDIDFLVQNGILVNWLADSSAAAELLNDLCTEITYDSDKFYFSSLCENLNVYCKVYKNNWKTAFKRNYFSTPLRKFASLAATVMLVFTFVQTICSIISIIYIFKTRGN